MEEYKKIDKINNHSKFLIDYININEGLIKYQKKFLNKEEMDKFYKNNYLGVPLILPDQLECFNYSENSKFKINKKDIQKYIFKTKNMNHTGLKLFFLNGVMFNNFGKPKKEYTNLLKSISKINNDLKKKIISLKKKNKKIASFQTRNIPHFGHEKIIELLLKKNDYVFINPLIGPKKRGDVKNQILYKVYNYLSKNFYDGRLIFKPVCANMFYAGPREAIHHALIREMLGFDTFIVGRDHAGTDNAYKSNDAINLVNKNIHRFKINVITHKGSYFSKKLNKVVIFSGKQKTSDLVDISGREFREKLLKNQYFKFARKDLQTYVFNLNEKLFF